MLSSGWVVNGEQNNVSWMRRMMGMRRLCASVMAFALLLPFSGFADPLLDALGASSAASGANTVAFNPGLYRWIRLDGVTYGVRKHVDAGGDAYEIVNGRGVPLRDLPQTGLDRLAWTWEMLGVTYLQGESSHDLQMLQASIHEVSRRSEQIQALVWLQDKLMQTGVAGVAIYLNRGDAVAKMLTSAALDELKGAILNAPETVAHGVGVAIVGAASDRLGRLMAFGQRRRMSAGQSPSNPVDAEMVQQRYKDAIWVNAYAMPATRLIMDTQPGTGAGEQIARMGGVVASSAADMAVPKDKEALKAMVASFFEARDISGALNAAVPAYGRFMQQTRDRLTHWQGSKTGLGDAPPGHYRRFVSAPAARASGMSSGKDYLVLYHNGALSLIREVGEDEQQIEYNTAFDLERGDNLFRVFLLDRFRAGVTPERLLTASNILAASEPRSFQADLKLLDLMLTLSWNTSGTDVDLHLVRQSPGNFGGALDCYYHNKRPDWGGSEHSPALDIDDTNGYGPENIVVSKLRDGKYFVIVDYFSDGGRGASDASLTMRIQGRNPVHLGPIHLPRRNARVVAVELMVEGGRISAVNRVPVAR